MTYYDILRGAFNVAQIAAIVYIGMMSVAFQILIIAPYILVNGKLQIQNGELLRPLPNQELCKKSPCGENAECLYAKHLKFCRCLCGYYGNPYNNCIIIPQHLSRRVNYSIQINMGNTGASISSEDLYGQMHNGIEMGIERLIGGRYKGYIEYSFYMENLK